jgi:hypothetical protein
MMDVIDYTKDLLIVGVGVRYLLPRIIGRYVEKKMANEPAEFARWEAIWDHYRLRKAGQGHDTENVTACGQGRCARFA